MTTKSKKTARAFKILPRDGISAVWLVPIVALIFGAWLIIKSIAERGVFITIQLENASGITVGKTKVKYKGLDAGVVREVDVTDDMQGVVVSVEMLPSTKDALTENTQFWFVTADVSFQGVKGLDTLLSGSYINVVPDFTREGKAKRHFIALDEEPVLDVAVPGLHISLQTSSLGSVAKNSPITFKQITVGYVSGFQYIDETEKVEINLFIEPEYQHLVKKTTRFWNASGIDISGSITSGFKLRTESVASIVTGGIAFDTDELENSRELAQNGDRFRLHKDYEEAQMAEQIELLLSLDSGISINSPIMYHGIELGRIDEIVKIDTNQRFVRVNARINPRVASYLTDDSEFYVISAQLDLGGVNNLSNLITGSYIGMRPSEAGNPVRSFRVYNDKPAYKYTEPGVHLVLKADNASSLKLGSGVYYKKQQVGTVQAIETLGPDNFNVHIHIKDEYKNYVSTDSRFWHASGIKISGGLQNFEIEAQSVQSMLTGAIAFDKGKSKEKVIPNNGDNFQLFNERSVAKQRMAFTLDAFSKKSLSRNTRIIYRGQNIGSVHSIKNGSSSVKITAGVLPAYSHILKADSQFWLVEPSISLAGITDTEALFGGAYINVNVGQGDFANHFTLNEKPPAKHHSSDGLQLALSFETGNVVNPGSPISYRGVLVGEVDNIALEQDGSNVDINITIDDDYRHLINNYTRFYNASGVTMSGSIGNFIIKTESADAILKGGISFYNPEDINDQHVVKAEEGALFTLYSNIEHAQNAGLAIEIFFNDSKGLKEGTEIKYQDQEIGLVERLVFDEEQFGVTVFAFLNDKGRKFAVEGSKFWLAEPQIGLVGSKNVGAIFEGGFISIIPGKGINKTKFMAEDIPPVVERLPYGLNLKLVSDKLGSVRVGNPVLYRQVPVGEVIGVALSDTSDKVDIYINIANRFKPLVSSGSKFWNTSGFKVDAGVFSGVKIESESMETLMAGGIAFATPEGKDDSPITPVAQDSAFELHQAVDEDWFDWQPKITLED